MATIQPIQVSGTKRPAGHYSQAIVHDGLIYVSGQIPADLETGTPRPGTIEAQTELALGNVRRILEAAGSSLDRTLQMTIYITSIDDWAAVNATYIHVMGAHRPARAIVPVSPLHFGCLIEIQAIAAAGPRRRTARRTRPVKKAPARRRAALRSAR
jgi:2-iminobutanoate/2-iminopropanoate deaminase